MGIEASYRRITPDEFQQLCDDPLKAEQYFGLNYELDDTDFDAYQEALDASESYLDIGKDWQGLHFLLTGKAEMDTTEVAPPLGNVVLGGRPTAWEATYGMVRFLTPEEVRDVAVALEQIDELELRSRLDHAVFRAADIYPSAKTWDTVSMEMLLDIFAQVRDFYLTASRNGDVMLLAFD